MNKVILVDDHYIVRQGLRFLLSTIENIEVLQDFGRWRNIFRIFKRA
ncbi:Two-component response regulator-like protein [Staphylococcus aureus]|uniref:Two-component response regulator-like protein n=1 Tax=Staphylococcus aureus TaxID=1280 RepID=A0A380EJK3_STAAU|nr:Two-component response regulator-like protein [Staphylococcus aureus]